MFANSYFPKSHFVEAYFPPVTIDINTPVTGGGDFYYRKEGGINVRQEEEEMVIILTAFMEIIE